MILHTPVQHQLMNPIQRLIEIIDDWQFLIRRDGVIVTIPLIASEIARLPYRHLEFLILAVSLDNPLPDLHPKMPLDIRPFTETDLKLIREVNRPSEARLCARRLARNHHGFIAMNHSQAAGYAWGCAEINPQLERVQLKLDLGDILCNDAFTTPAYRNQGVQTSLVLARVHFFQVLGYKRALCYIEKTNKPSISVWQRKLNGSIIGQIDFKRIGPYYQVKFSD